MKKRVCVCVGIAVFAAVVAGCASGKTEVMSKATMPPWFGEQPPQG